VWVSTLVRRPGVSRVLQESEMRMVGKLCGPCPRRARQLCREAPVWRLGHPRDWLSHSLLGLSGVPDATAQPVQFLCTPANSRTQVPLLLPGVWCPLPLCLLPDPREGELPALCPQGGLQVGAAWLTVLELPSGWSFPSART
jgi:hypothetical protein